MRGENRAAARFPAPDPVRRAPKGSAGYTVESIWGSVGVPPSHTRNSVDTPRPHLLPVPTPGDSIRGVNEPGSSPFHDPNAHRSRQPPVHADRRQRPLPGGPEVPDAAAVAQARVHRRRRGGGLRAAHGLPLLHAPLGDLGQPGAEGGERPAPLAGAPRPGEGRPCAGHPGPGRALRRKAPQRRDEPPGSRAKPGHGPARRARRPGARRRRRPAATIRPLSPAASPPSTPTRTGRRPASASSPSTSRTRSRCSPPPRRSGPPRAG